MSAFDTKKHKTENKFGFKKIQKLVSIDTAICDNQNLDVYKFRAPNINFVV